MYWWEGTTSLFRDKIFLHRLLLQTTTKILLVGFTVTFKKVVFQYFCSLVTFADSEWGPYVLIC